MDMDDQTPGAVKAPLEAPVRRVVCAAIRAADGDLMLGVRHYSVDMHAQMHARRDGAKFAHRHGEDQGFVDQLGAYMTRSEAFTVARAAEQIVNWDACDIAGWRLYSEGLY
jgi:hypothetical protein